MPCWCECSLAQFRKSLAGQVCASQAQQPNGGRAKVAGAKPAEVSWSCHQKGVLAYFHHSGKLESSSVLLGGRARRKKRKRCVNLWGWTKKLLPQMLLGGGDDPVKQPRAPGKSLLFLSPPNPLCTGDFGVELA